MKILTLIVLLGLWIPFFYVLYRIIKYGRDN
jgi:hypothetical protein